MKKPSEIYSSIRGSIRDLSEVYRGNIGVMALSWFLFSITGSLINPFFAKFVKDLGASDLEVAYMRSIGMLTLALSLIPGGILTDYLGRVKTILIGTALVAVVQFLYAIAPEWRTLMVIYVIDQAVHFYQPALTAIVMDSLRRGSEFKGFIGLNIVTAIPSLFMPVIGGVLYEEIGVDGIRLGFVIQGVITLIVFVIRVKTLKETFKPLNKDLSRVVFELSDYRGVLSRAFKFYLFTSILWQITHGVPGTFLALYVLEVIGISKPLWGFMSTISTMGMIASSLILVKRNPCVEKISIVSALVISTLLFSYTLIYYYRNPLFTVILLIVISLVGSIFSNILNSSLSTIQTRILPVEIRGRAVAIQRLLDNLGASIASIAAAALYIGIGQAESFMISSIIGLISCLYLYVILLRRL